MGDVGVELGPAVGVAGGPVLVQLVAALIAVTCPQVILAAALLAPVGELSAGHGHERTFGPFDDLEIADDEGIVKRDRAKGQETFVVVFHELDANFGDLHSCSPLICGNLEGQR